MDKAEERVRTALYDIMTLMKEEKCKIFPMTHSQLYDTACDICDDNDINPLTAQVK